MIAAQTLLGLLFGSIFFFFRYELAGVYASKDPNILEHLVRLMALYALFIHVDMNLLTTIIICRSANHSGFLTVMFTVFVVVVYFFLVLFLHLRYDADCTTIFIVQYSCIFAALAISLAKVMAYDWRKIVLLTR